MPSDPALAQSTASLRSFNRAYTRFLGTLNDHYLRTDFSLAEGRVLYELATAPRPQAKEIAQNLGLDPGYLSRILRKFVRAGLVARSTASRDRRASDLRLTARGRTAVRTLNTRADDQAHVVLGKLSAAQRTQLATAVSIIEDTLLGVRRGADSIVLRTHHPGDMGMVVHLEGAGYVDQLGWDQTFEALTARIVADFIQNYNPSRERCWIAERNGVHVGHIFLVQHPDEPGTAKLRLLYVDPAARGTGLGTRLVTECVAFARSAGYKKITLWTQSILSSAHRIYHAAGFQLVREEPHHSFGKDLVGQTWELNLA
jgi:DNA-binding MarR family transcriptional regulator/GNAT superfamily N-acetyltransferase